MESEPQIEPGDKFLVEYGNGHRIQVQGLNTRNRIRAVKLMGAMQKATDVETTLAALEELVALVRVCAPQLTDEDLDNLDDTQMTQIVSATVFKSRVDEEAAKKSE